MHISLAPVTLHQPYACSSKNLSIQGLGFCFLIKSWSSVFQGEAKTLSATVCHGHPVTTGSLRAHQVQEISHHQEPLLQDLNTTKPIFMHPVLTADALLQWDVISELSMLHTKEHFHRLLDCFNIRKKTT